MKLCIVEELNVISVTWHGHACFEVDGEQGTVIMDPFRGTGLPEPTAKADVVLCSHSHGDHNNPDPVCKQSGVVLVGFVGKREVTGIQITGVSTYHDDAKGDQRGANSVYVFSVDGVTFCHLGDIGHLLSENQVKEIASIDVLFVPVGGFFTIGPDEAISIISRLKPKIVVPMHYNISGMAPMFSKLHGVADFLKGKRNVNKINKASFTVSKSELPEDTTIIVPSIR